METESIEVLLIEGDRNDALIIDHWLAQASGVPVRFRLTCADRLSAGTKLLARGKFDVVLLDLLPPGGGGIESYLRVREHNPSTPIIVLTQLKDEGLAARAVRLGAQDYLVKGIFGEALLKSAIRYAIERGKWSERMEKLLAEDQEAKVIVDSDGLVRFMNASAEALLGRSAKELLGRAFPYPLAPPLAELKIRRGDGAEKTGQARVIDIDWAGAPARLVCLREITEQRRLERLQAELSERVRAVELKDEFMATIAHELRNPLATVKTAVHSLRDGSAGSLTARQRNFVEMAHRNVERQVKIINNILDLSRFQSGKARIEFRRVDLASLIRETVQWFGLADKPPKIELAIDEQLPEIEADPDLVAQVLSNLLDNALRFARKKVLVKAAGADKATVGACGTLSETDILLSVIDDGPGIAAHRLGELFNRFVQADRPAGNRGYKGTGLGLAICKEIVERHGGRIWGESVLGSGSRFHCVFRRHAASGAGPS